MIILKIELNYDLIVRPYINIESSFFFIKLSHLAMEKVIN